MSLLHYASECSRMSLEHSWSLYCKDSPHLHLDLSLSAFACWYPVVPPCTSRFFLYHPLHSNPRTFRWLYLLISTVAWPLRMTWSIWIQLRHNLVRLALDQAAFILSFLGSELSVRDYDNRLVELFECQSFQTSKFLKHHDVIVWCASCIL